MTDLSKLPWDELELPEFRNRKSYVKTLSRGGFSWCKICYSVDTVLASQIYHQPKRWSIENAIPVDEIEQIAKMCRMVEEFIERHGGKNGL